MQFFKLSHSRSVSRPPDVLGPGGAVERIRRYVWARGATPTQP